MSHDFLSVRFLWWALFDLGHLRNLHFMYIYSKASGWAFVTLKTLFEYIFSILCFSGLSCVFQVNISNPNIETVLQDLKNTVFQEGTPIYTYDYKKIELCDSLRSCGR